MGGRRSALWVALLLTAAWAPVARANVFEQTGFGPRGIGMAGALTADARDYSAVFYNPALLTTRTDFGVGLSFLWTRAATQVTAKDLSRTLDCEYCQPEDAAGFSLGLLFPLAGKVKNRLAIGVGVHIPSGRLVRASAADTDRPAWYFYKNSPERIVVYLGAGVRILDELHLGIGLQVLANLIGDGANVKIDLFSKEVRFRELDVYLASRGGPTAGLSFMPKPWLRFGLSYRWEMALDYAIPARIDLVGIGQLALIVSGVVHYSPHTFNVGAAWDVTDDVTITADANWALWSRAPTPYMQLDVDVSGETLRGLGLDDILDLKSGRQAPGFSDTITGRLGLEYRVSPRFAARLGAFYRPTPVPRQDVPGTNILDASALGASVGAMIGFPDPLEVFSKDIHLELAGQAQLLLPREANKEATDTVPAYTYDGKIYSLNVAFNYAF